TAPPLRDRHAAAQGRRLPLLDRPSAARGTLGLHWEEPGERADQAHVSLDREVGFSRCWPTAVRNSDPNSSRFGSCIGAEDLSCLEPRSGHNTSSTSQKITTLAGRRGSWTFLACPVGLVACALRSI